MQLYFLLFADKLGVFPYVDLAIRITDAYDFWVYSHNNR